MRTSIFIRRSARSSTCRFRSRPTYSRKGSHAPDGCPWFGAGGAGRLQARLVVSKARRNALCVIAMWWRLTIITIATFLSYCEPRPTSALTPKRPRSRAPRATHEQAGSRPAQKRYKLIAGEIGAATDRLGRKHDTIEQDDFSSNRHPALVLLLSMIFSENRCP